MPLVRVLVLHALAVALGLLSLRAGAQTPPTRLVVVLVAIRPQLDTMAAGIRSDDTERLSCVTREVTFQHETTRYVIPLRLDTAQVQFRGQAVVLTTRGGCADSLPTVHTHRERTPENNWVTGPSPQDSATARAHPKASWQAIVTDSGRVILYGIRP